jgi:hypothetical protein
MEKKLKNRYTLNEFRAKKYLGCWIVGSIEEGKGIVESLKITGKENTYNIENEDGRVLWVRKPITATPEKEDVIFSKNLIKD